MAEPKEIKTPDGLMHVSGLFRQFGSLFCDLFVAFFIAILLKQLVLSLWPETPATEPVVLILTFGYPLFGRLGMAPSLGRWAFGLRPYAFTEIEGYVGKGRLWAYDPLSRRTYIARKFIVITAIMTLYALNVAVLP